VKQRVLKFQDRIDFTQTVKISLMHPKQLRIQDPVTLTQAVKLSVLRILRDKIDLTQVVKFSLRKMPKSLLMLSQYVRMKHWMQMPCPMCNGTGSITFEKAFSTLTRTCPTCNGRTWINVSRT
jgi:hypothetical protein